MSKVFSDEQIVKAISICLQHHKDCNECPLVDIDNCTILRKYALDLISRLKREVERLYNIKLDLEHQLTQKGLTEYAGADVIQAETRKKTAKEFAETLKQTLIINNEENTEYFDYQYTLETIDEITKQCSVEVDNDR